MDLAIYLPDEGGVISAAEFDLLGFEPSKTYLLSETPLENIRAAIHTLIEGKERIWVGPYMGYAVDIDPLLPVQYEAELMDANTLLSLVGVIPPPWDESLTPLQAVEKMVDDIRERVSSILTSGI